jgi:predicted  nucleic acid-binding Zn-ribbon protein
MSQVTVLYHLQQLDTQIDHIKNELVEINRRLADDASVKGAQAALTQAQADLRSRQKKLKMAEDAVRMQQIKIQETETALYGGKIKIPKELQDLQKDIISLKKHLDILENAEIDEMLAVEAVQAELEKAELALQRATVESMEKNAGLNGQKITLDREMIRLSNEKQAVASSLNNDDLELYERLRKSKRGIAVSALASGSCSACGAMLTPADRQSARSPNQVYFCPSCGRIIYAG